MTLRVALVVPDRELWAGEARTVIAKTTEGDIGVLTGHSPVFGILAEGSLVEILSDEVDREEARRELDAAQSEGSGPEEPAEVKYARAQLRAAGDQA